MKQATFGELVSDADPDSDGGDDGDGPPGTLTCGFRHADIDRGLIYHHRREWDVEDLIERVDAAERDGCIDADDATVLRRRIESGPPDDIERLLKRVQQAF